MPRSWQLVSALVPSILFPMWMYFDPGWEPGILAIVSVLTLIKVLIDPIQLNTGTGFNAGHRLRWCRKNENWRPSEASELLGIESEHTYRQMERGNVAVSPEILQKLSDLTGADLDWLKHGSRKDRLQSLICSFMPTSRSCVEVTKSPYPPIDLRPYDDDSVEQAVQLIFSEEPDSLFFAINPDTCHQVYLITQKEHRYVVWDLHGLHLWEEHLWAGDYKYLPCIYRFYASLVEHEHCRVIGIYLNHIQMVRMHWGFIHPQKIISEALNTQCGSNIRYWPDDLLDYRQQRGRAKDYKQWYGQWLPKAQRYLARHVEPQPTQDKNQPGRESV